MNDLKHKKVLSEADAMAIIAEKKAAGKSVVFTNGCFDILHRGHVQYLQAARALGDALIVGLNSDASVRGLKGSSRPILNEDARAYMLASLSCVDYVVLFKEDTPERLLSELRPTVLVKGADWQGQELPGSEYADRVEFMEFLEGWSTTDIIGKIKSVLKDENAE